MKKMSPRTSRAKRRAQARAAESEIFTARESNFSRRRGAAASHVRQKKSAAILAVRPFFTPRRGPFRQHEEAQGDRRAKIWRSACVTLRTETKETTPEGHALAQGAVAAVGGIPRAPPVFVFNDTATT